MTAASALSRFPILDGLLAPGDLKSYDASRLLALGEELRRCIRETVTATGGHLSSNLGVVELTIALHRVFDFASDRILWDVGHQAYVHKLLTGRFPQFRSVRQEGGLSGFPDPKESPYDIAKVGHSSTAISTGVGVAEGYRRRGQQRKTVVVVGDGALTGGMCFEGLINAGELKSDLLMVLNDNGNFIDAPVGSLHRHFDHIRSGKSYNRIRERLLHVLKRLPGGETIEKLAEHAEAAAHRLVTPGYMFEELGFRYFGPIDGHDVAAVQDELERVRHLREPVLLHVHTKKGGGWAPAQQDPLTYHGPKGFDPDTGAFHPKPPARATYSEVLTTAVERLMREDERVVAITAAMPSGTGLRAVGQRLPGRVYDVGICEQHSFAFAQGLAVAGVRPVVAHYSTFAQRGFDQFFQELVVQRDLGIVVTLDRAGLVGEDGETHQGLYDISWTRCFPGTVLLAPKDGPELEAMLRWAHARHTDPQRAAAYVIRYPKEAVPERSWPTQDIELGRAEILQEGDGPLMIWAYGIMAWRAAAALDTLEPEQARRVTLVNARFAKPFDDATLARLSERHPRCLTLEDHALPGGFGSCLTESAADQGLDLAVRRLGVRDELVPHAPRERQLTRMGLDVPSIAAAIRRALGVADAGKTIAFPA